MHEPAQPLRRIVSDVDEELEAIVMSCLEKDPARRPPRASDLAASLVRYRSAIAGSARASVALHTVELRGRGWSPPAAAAPLIGREKELVEAQARLNAAIGGESQFLLFEGEAGIGKTRLLEQIERIAQAREVRTLHGNFSERDEPYQGFCELFEAHVRRASSSGTSEGNLGELEDELCALFPILADLRPGRARSNLAARPSGVVPERDRTAVFDLLARALARIAGDQPLVILMDDLHAASASIDALQYVARRLGATRTLLVGAFTSTDVDKNHPLAKLIDGFKDNKRFALMRLERFTPVEHKAFLSTLSVGTAVDDSLSLKLWEAAEGNPFFTRELFRSLVDSGALARQERGSWALSGDTALSIDAVPATIQKAVARRLERLPDELRKVLSIASVLGKAFEEHELEALLEDDEVDLDEAIEKLVRGGFLEEQRKGRGDRLAFTSGAMREVLYAEIARRKRRTLHRRIAEHLEKKHSGRVDRVRAQLVHHFAQADDAEKVFEHGLVQARSALSAFSAEDAARAARSVLGFVEEGAGSTASIEADARVLLASAYRMTGELDAALKELEVAVKVLEAGDDPPRLLRAYLEAADISWDARKVTEAKRWVDKGVSAARAAGDVSALGRLLSIGITVANLRGDRATARDYIEESERLKAAVHRDEPIARGGTVRVALANPVRAEEPWAAVVDEEIEVLSNVFETLLATDEHGNVVPRLCELWEALEGGSRFAFRLRAGVVRHDGAPLTALDVKKSLESAARAAHDTPPSALAAIRGIREWADSKSDQLEGVEVTGDQTFSIRLAGALPLFPALLTDGRTAIACEPAQGGARVGTGRFKVRERSPGRVLLERNDTYWGPRAHVDTLEYSYGLASSEVSAGFRAGRFDLVRDLPPAEIDELLRDRRAGVGWVERSKKNTSFVLFRTASEVARHDALRHALSGAVATSDLVWRHLGRLAQPAEGLIPAGILGHDAGRRRSLLARDRALELVESTGLARPIKLRAAVHPAYLDRYASVTRALFDAWKAIGVEIEVVTGDLQSFIAKTRNPEEVDVALARWAADYDDPDNFTHALFHSEAGLYRALHSSPSLDRTLVEARLEPSPHKRATLYRKIEEGLLASHVVLPLWHDKDFRLFASNLADVALVPAPPYVDYSALYVRPAPSGAAVRRRAGGTLVVPLELAPPVLDPSTSSHTDHGIIYSCAFESLTRETKDARIVPRLASSFAAENGGRRFRFVLRDRVHFHDGRPLTSRDVRFSFERLLANRESTNRAWLSPILGAPDILEGRAQELAGFHLLSAREFVIDLDRPVPLLPALLCHEQMAIVPEGFSLRGGSWREGFVGTGPFRLVRFDPERRLELEANPHYWRPSYPKADALSFVFGVPGDDALALFRAGRCSIVNYMKLADIENLLHDPAMANRHRAAVSLTTMALVFDTRRGFFADEEVRRTVVRSLDVDAAVRAAGRMAVRARTLIPPGLLGHDPTRGPDQARPSKTAYDTEVHVLVSPSARNKYEPITRAVVETMKRLGIRTRLSPGVLPHDEDVDAYIGAWVSDYPDPDAVISQLHTKLGTWGKHSGNAQLDALVESARVELDPNLRAATYRRIEAYLEEHAVLVPLAYGREFLFAAPNVRGLDDDVLPRMTGGPDLAVLWIEE